MSRGARNLPSEGYLHVYSRGNNRRKLFLYPCDFKVFLRILSKLKRAEAVKVFHYCLMPNHVHLLLGVSKDVDTSRFMKRLNLKYSLYYRKKRAYVGHLWQGRFKSRVIEEESSFMRCGKYIELNPVRANIVKQPQDYPYSSYCHFALGREDPIVDDSPLYLDLGGTVATRQLRYREIIIGEEADEEFHI